MLQSNSSTISMHNQCDGCVFGLRQFSCELACEYCLLHQLLSLNRYHPFSSNDFFPMLYHLRAFAPMYIHIHGLYICICVCICIYIYVYVYVYMKWGPRWHSG